MDAILGTVTIAVATFVFLVTTLRLAGKRTVAKWNAFDLIVTVALGSTLATTAASKGANWREGMLVIVVLIFAQSLISYLCRTSHVAERLTKSVPTLLVANGRLVEELMEEERVLKSDILSALRSAGISDLSKVGAVVLETNGSLSVLKEANAGSTCMHGVRGRSLLLREEADERKVRS